MNPYLLNTTEIWRQYEWDKKLWVLRVSNDRWLAVRCMDLADTCSRWVVNGDKKQVFTSKEDAMMFAETEHLLIGNKEPQ